ncbi:MAG: LPS-assembly protein LptD [Spartobacteria bacterium]|nr:LPS-assembly protein LptD [Spartobacteria bacterium]
MNMTRVVSAITMTVVALMGSAHMVSGQTLTETNTPAPQGIEVTADRLEYEAEGKLLVGIGNVLVQQGPDVLRADCITVNTETEEAYATGNVIFEREGRIWQGDELKYNFRDDVGDFGITEAYIDPYYVFAEESERVSESVFELRDVTLTTCEGEDPQFYIRSKNASLTDQSVIRAKNVVFFLQSVPIFYFPYFKYDINRQTNWDILPGYSSLWGAYLLTAYNYRMNDYMHGATHLDYRSKRGFGVGQDFKWRSETNSLRGDFKSYYADDQQPYRDEDQEEERGKLVDAERYRLSLVHAHMFTPRDYFLVNAGYLSDPYILEDFFRNEFREEAEPSHEVSLSHRGDNFSAGVLINKRLNDFYENVDRLPEVNLAFQRQRIADSWLYYEGENSMVYLKKLYPEDSGKEEYDTFRLDSGHTLLYPTRHFGFLNVIPRVGYQGTYFTETREEETREVVVEIATTNEVVDGITNSITSLTNRMETFTKDGGAKFRNLFEIGMESSFKAFKVMVEPVNGEGGLRHVAEPYIDYTYVPEPNVRPTELYQFDSIDRLDKRNDIKLGMRNKLQTRQRATIFDPVALQTNEYAIIRDIVDLDIYTYYHFESEDPDGRDFSPVYFDGQFRFTRWMMLDAEGSFDTYDSEFRELDARCGLVTPDSSRVYLQYTYRKDRGAEDPYNNSMTLQLDLFPEKRWSLGTFWRYDLDDSYMEEQGYYVERRFSCLGTSVGYSGRGSDWDVWFEVWLLALPQSRMAFEGRY